jgi:hypothetical protein
MTRTRNSSATGCSGIATIDGRLLYPWGNSRRRTAFEIVEKFGPGTTLPIKPEGGMFISTNKWRCKSGGLLSVVNSPGQHGCRGWFTPEKAAVAVVGLGDRDGPTTAISRCPWAVRRPVPMRPGPR